MEDHTLLTKIALERSFPVERVTTVVPLSGFLATHGVEFAALVARSPELRPATTPSDGATPEAFARLLRINPRYEPALYVKVVPGGDALIDRTGAGRGVGAAPAASTPASAGAGAQPADAGATSALPSIPSDRRREFSAIASAPFPYPYAAFQTVEPGEELSALDVLASAADEPDYGMDLELFCDSGTEWGREYGFGRQPFGNPGNQFTTQAPFHMAFFHESPAVYRIAPALRRSFVLLRVRQFTALAQFAMDRGCDYWGLRFAGWALHYVQDLTMPYHATVLPGKRPATIVALGIMRAAGISGPYRRAIEDVTEKHVRLERVLLDALYAGDAGDLVRALAPDPVLPDQTSPDSVLPDSVLPDSVLPDQTLPDATLPHWVGGVARPPNVAPSAAASPSARPPHHEFELSRLSGGISARAAALGPAADRALDQAGTDPEPLRRVLVAMLRETGNVTREFTAGFLAGY